MQLDLASLKSIDSFAKAFQAEHATLDVLVNNAGVMAIPSRELTEDGFEKQMGVCVCPSLSLSLSHLVGWSI